MPEEDAGSGNRKGSVSIVIPCLNEQENLSRCLVSIGGLNYDGGAIEVIVVDNGSIDRSREIAEAWGAKVLRKTGGTIGALRNHGARVARGEVLAFVDADCEVGRDWAASFMRYFETNGNGIGVVGSPPGLPAGSNLIQKAWFSHRQADLIGEVDYVGSANMILRRSLFDEVGGFSEVLPSGEDFELCSRIRQRGYKVVSDHRVTSYHYGYPQTLGEFARREIWHGRGMVADFKDPGASRPLLLSALYLFLNAALLCCLGIGLLRWTPGPFYAVGGILALEGLPVALLALKKSLRNGTLRYLPVLTILYYLYGVSRSCSLVLIGYDRLRKRGASA
ncbi:MAG: glycosyltransferase [bacterium]